MFSIGELSRETGVKIPTIRYYEQMELIEAPARTIGNQRRYTQEGMQRLSFIKHSRGLGFTIDDVRELLELQQHPDRSCGNAHSIAMRHLEDVAAKIEKLRKLEKELKRITKCSGNSLSDCEPLGTLSDHNRCLAEH